MQEKQISRLSTLGDQHETRYYFDTNAADTHGRRASSLTRQ